MDITAGSISSFSIIPAVIAALLNYRKNRDFRPFCYLIFLGGAVEAFSFYSSAYRYNNLWLFNIFTLLQFYLIMFQFYTWKLLSRESIAGIAAVAIVTILWTAESFKYSLYLELNSYSLVFSSFFIVIFSTVYINRLIFYKIESLLTDARFLISIGLLIYFTTNVIVFIFTRDHDMSRILFTKLWTIHDIINTFTNIIFAAGLLCIRKN